MTDDITPASNTETDQSVIARQRAFRSFTEALNQLLALEAPLAAVIARTVDLYTGEDAFRVEEFFNADLTQEIWDIFADNGQCLEDWADGIEWQ